MDKKSYLLWNERRFKAMKKRLNGIYNTAIKELTEKWEKETETVNKRTKVIAKKIRESKDPKEVQNLIYEYQRILRNAKYDGERYETMINDLANDIVKTNETATKLINEQSAEIYSYNYNFEAKNLKVTIKDKLSKNINFTIYNKRIVGNLAKENKRLLPTQELNENKDLIWNLKKINAQVLQSIIQGESVADMAKRIQSITKSNYKTAIRHARTMNTSVCNKARIDAMLEARERGTIIKKVWHSVQIPKRTRAWHSKLDSVEKELEEPFENKYGEIMYPGDPNAHPANVNNCMCTLDEEVTGFRSMLKGKKDVIKVKRG